MVVREDMGLTSQVGCCEVAEEMGTLLMVCRWAMETL